MHPFFTTLRVHKGTVKPVFLQLNDLLIQAIQNGDLPRGTRLPGSRAMATLLGIHRKTAVRAYEDLIAQGWLETLGGSGTFVAQKLPILKPKALSLSAGTTLKSSGINMIQPKHLDRVFTKALTMYHLDDGLPDVRLAPLLELSRAYRSQLLQGDSNYRLGYEDPQGAERLREQLVKHLFETRGLQVTDENLLITRGTVMSLYLTCTALLKPGDVVVTALPGWTTANASFLQAGAELISVNVDDNGLSIEELTSVCKKRLVRMVYVTPHHHYPTTAVMRADKRMELIGLAERYGFIIFEDDYDYDYHYLNKPITPLATLDKAGLTLYAGSFTKSIAPAFRVGYLVGPPGVIKNLSQLRRIVDRQGDTSLDNAVAQLLSDGVIQRHLRKTLKIYRQRRDYMAKLLVQELGDRIFFNKPEGGMAIWATFSKDTDLQQVAARAVKSGLYLADGVEFRNQGYEGNSIRLGFASSDLQEIERSISILKKSLSY